MRPLQPRLLVWVVLAVMGIALSGCAALVVGGALTAVAVAEDRRTPGTMLDDQTIETRALFRIKNRFGDQAHVNVTSFNRHVLLSGEAISQAVKEAVEAELRAVAPNIVRLHNELVVGPLASLRSVANDARLTALIKTRFLADGRFQANHVKVVTEAGTVFLMGLVSRAEAAAASEVAASTAGVRRVVTLFEYLD
ncbi:MAG: BON domain-containing protein [Casimicrobiaceae bacterium]|nr:BON domain-containing protein [Casimicrobiaceae bacterium]MDW8311137.1 BON domain-containing protein [Burkholderiales bacterium]